MAQYSVSDPIREVVQGLATAWDTSYLLRSDPSWWCFDPTAGRPAPRQGWRLHVSTTPLEALDTLLRVAEVVLPRGLTWKVANSLDGAPAGRFITVYAEGDDVTELAQSLHEVTKHVDAPALPGERRFRRGSNVYLRNGAFAGMNGTPEPGQGRRWLIVDEARRRKQDRREQAPPWAMNRPGSFERPGAGLFGRDIVALSVLHQPVKGGVYRCRWHGREVVLKEARVGACPDLLGRDARSRLRNEWQVLRALAGTGLAPEPLDFFVADDNAYLVEEFLPGTMLRAHVEALNYCGQTDPRRLLALWHAVSAMVAAVRPRRRAARPDHRHRHGRR